MTKRALITGIGGQDGSYLTELLLSKGYEVHGMVRRGGVDPIARLAHVAHKVTLHKGDLTSQESLVDVLRASRPHEVYNLAGTSFVGTSWEDPVATADLTASSVIRMLQALRDVAPRARFYQASTSEIFGTPDDMPQSETTRIQPTTPYGVAKSYGHFITVSYRETYGLFACAGILYNHESPRRGPEFVTRKITRGAAAIKLGLETDLLLGDLDVERDWGYAGDYVDAMWRMLQQDEPSDYVIATGKLHSVRDVVEAAFGRLGLDPRAHVGQDERFIRPAEVHRLVGDASKARTRLDWKPTIGFDELIALMVDHDLRSLRGEATVGRSLGG